MPSPCSPVETYVVELPPKTLLKVKAMVNSMAPQVELPNPKDAAGLPVLITNGAFQTNPKIASGTSLALLVQVSNVMERCEPIPRLPQVRRPHSDLRPQSK